MAVVALLAGVLVPVGAVALLVNGSWSEPRQVSVYPSPGGRVVAPGAQISFRGIGAEHLRVTVRGSSTGLHLGSIRAHSDGKGGSFVPDKPFAAGETVTVSSNQSVRGAAHGRFQLTIASPAGAVPNAPLPPAQRADADVQRFHTEPKLTPAALTVHGRIRGAASDGIFLAPQQGPVQNGPMILDRNGQLVWFKPLPSGTEAADFRVQRYHGAPVLTWWQGQVGAGVGRGEGVIMDSSYRQIASVRAAGGLGADLHEFQLTPRGTALITAYYPVYWDASSVHGSARQIVLDSVVQEIDIKTGLLVFQWDSLDHVPLSDAYTETPKQAGSPLDYFHVNAIDDDRDGNLVISARNTWAAYKVNRETGKVMWVLGGKRSSFTMAPGATFAFQHDVRVRADSDRVVTLFDNGGGPPRAQEQSRGLRLALDLRRMTATRLGEYRHVPALPANFEGNVQELPGGEVFAGWGQQPYFAQFNSHGKLVGSGRFISPTANYRAYLFPWHATPTSPPAMSASTHDGRTVVYVSWNGATDVASWRILAGERPDDLKAVVRADKHGFETTITLDASRYVSVEALDTPGHVLSSSAVVRVG